MHGGGKAGGVISLCESMFNIILRPDKFMQSENTSNIANSNAIQVPRCSINIVDRVQVYRGETQKFEPCGHLGSLVQGLSGQGDFCDCLECPRTMKMWLKSGMQKLTLLPALPFAEALTGVPAGKCS